VSSAAAERDDDGLVVVEPGADLVTQIFEGAVSPV